MLTVVQIKECLDLREEVVRIPEWKGENGKTGEVKVRSHTKRQGMQIRKASTDGSGLLDLDLYERNLLKECVIEPALDDAGVEVLLNKNETAVRRILRAINRVTGTSQEAADEEDKSFRN